MIINGPDLPPDAMCLELGLRRCGVNILDQVPSGLVLCDEEGTILFLNREGGKILRRDPAEVTGGNLAGILAPLAEILALPPDPQREGAARIVAAGTVPEPRVFGVSTNEVHGLAGDSGQRHYILVFRDITRLEATRRERDRLLRMATISRLLPTVAHEIRNPLAGIQSLVELLLKGDHDRSTREDLELILHEVDRLRLIVQGLDMESATLIRPAAETDVVREACEVIRLVRGRYEQSRVAIGLEAPAALRVGADPSIFRLVLLNLLNNALEACSPRDDVTVRLRHSEGQLELVVTDTGAGMSRETLERVTELFFSTKPRGSGIGLALVDRVVREAGGRLLIDSEPGQGTTVRVIIPVEVVSA